VSDKDKAAVIAAVRELLDELEADRDEMLTEKKPAAASIGPLRPLPPIERVLHAKLRMIASREETTLDALVREALFCPGHAKRGRTMTRPDMIAAIVAAVLIIAALALLPDPIRHSLGAHMLDTLLVTIVVLTVLVLAGIIWMAHRWPDLP
jgi:hypothetical protein